MSSNRKQLDIPAVESRKESFLSTENSVKRFLQRHQGSLKNCMIKSGLDGDMTNDNNPICVAFILRA